MNIYKVFHKHTYVGIVTYTIPTHYIHIQITNIPLPFNSLPHKTYDSLFLLFKWTLIVNEATALMSYLPIYRTINQKVFNLLYIY